MLNIIFKRKCNAPTVICLAKIGRVAISIVHYPLAIATALTPTWWMASGNRHVFQCPDSWTPEN